MVLTASVSTPVGRSVYTTLSIRVTISYPDRVRFPHRRMGLWTWILYMQPACLRLSCSNDRQCTLRRQTNAHSKGRYGTAPRTYMACPLQKSAYSLVQSRL